MGKYGFFCVCVQARFRGKATQHVQLRCDILRDIGATNDWRAGFRLKKDQYTRKRQIDKKKLWPNAPTKQLYGFHLMVQNEISAVYLCGCLGHIENMAIVSTRKINSTLSCGCRCGYSFKCKYNRKTIDQSTKDTHEQKITEKFKIIQGCSFYAVWGINLW